MGGSSLSPGDPPDPYPTPVPTPSPSASPVRITEVTYLQNDSSYSGTASYYTDQNMYGLVTVSTVKDASGNVVSRSEMLYDESGRSPGYRGNPTTAKAWDSTKGVVTNTSAYISTSARFNTYGNQYESTDAKGNTTTTVFDGTYNAFPVQVTSPVPSDGTYGSNTAFVTSMTYDYTSGLPLTTTDANGQTSTIEYNDPLLRPTRTIAPNGHQTITEYGAGTSEATRWVKVKTQIDETNWKEAISWFDGLGRSYKSQSIDTNGDVFALTCFDSFGRPSKTSNPFRNVANATCSTTSGIDWTTSTYDTANRPWKITTPDNAVVETTYSLATTVANIGTVVTVTDQALKQRRSITNALGQLTRVDEPNDAGQLGTVASPSQPTNYSYDTLNNLTTVNQGVQTRSFVYDSMSRLKTATNPESGLIQYAYDNNSNLTAKTDARLVVTNFVYDALNRVKNRNYTAPTGLPNYQATPNVSYFYDGVNAVGGIANSKGKLTKVLTSVSTTEYTAFDILGRVTASKQTTDGGDSAGYATSYVYNLSGALIEETYPSGRVVKNVLDNDGDLSIVQSKKNANFGFSNYAKSFTYTSAGAVSSMQLGNGKWESSQFNSRLQPTQIALGTVQSGTDKLKLNYTYGDWNGTSIDPTKNNGNIVQQIITVPTAGSSTGFTATQKYYYDSLNRIDDSTETISSTQTWRQDFTYDRYGNRRFNETNTSMPASFSNQALTNPTISTSNNRLTSTGWTYDGSGNTTCDPQSRIFVYDGENKQVAVKNSSSVTIGQYSYDGDGRRVKKYVPSTGETTIFVYDAGGKEIAEYSTIVADSSSAKVSYLTNDHLGSPRINTDVAGTVTARHDYHPFGEEVTAGRSSHSEYMPDSVRKQFTGYERDGETDLDFAQARYFDLGFGRFSSPDPLQASASSIMPQSWNRYTYSYNSPLRFADPTGMIPGDYVDEDGYYIGSDGEKTNTLYFVPKGVGQDTIISNEKKGLTTDRSQVAELELPDLNVRQEIGVNAVNRSNAKTASDRNGKNHEEGGRVFTTKEGQIAIPAKSGPVGTPGKDGAGATVITSDPAVPSLMSAVTDSTPLLEYHVHPAGKDSKLRDNGRGGSALVQEFYEQTPSSDKDIPNAGKSPTQFGYRLVVGAGDKSNQGQKVHFYNAGGGLGSMTTNGFVNAGRKRR